MDFENSNEHPGSLLDAAFGSMQVNNTIGDNGRYELTVHHFLYRGILVLIAVIAIFGNLIVIMSFWGDKQMTQSPFKTYTFSLAASDLFVGVAIVPFKMTLSYLVTWPFGTSVCVLWSIVDYRLPMVSICIMMALGVDRYRSVTSPLLYRSHSNRRRTVVVSVTSWLIGFVVWTPYILYKTLVVSERERLEDSHCRVASFRTNPWEFFQVLLGYVIPIVVMITLYAVVVRSVRRRLSRGGLSPPDKSSAEEIPSPGILTEVASAAQNALIVTGHSVTTVRLEMIHGSGRSGVDNNRKPHRTSLRDTVENQNLKCYKNVTLIVSTFLVCWLPFAACWSVFILFQVETPSRVLDYVGALNYARPAINPFIVMRSHPKISNDISRVVKVWGNIVNLRLRRKQ